MRKTRSIHKLYEILEESRDRNAIRFVSRKLTHLRQSGLLDEISLKSRLRSRVSVKLDQPGHYKGVESF